MRLFDKKAIWPNINILLRVWCGIIFIYYGKSFLHPDKVENFSKWLAELNIPLPLFSAYLSKGVEFIGGIFLIAGFLTRPVCILLAVNMAVATFIANKGDLIENGQGSFLLFLILLTIFCSEQTSLSVDNFILKQRQKNGT